MSIKVKHDGEMLKIHLPLGEAARIKKRQNNADREYLRREDDGG
jgi:hypothetical protein